VHIRVADIVRDLRNSSAGPYMDFGNVITVMFGLPALLGFTLLVSFGITFRKSRPPIRSTETRRLCRRPTQEK
jgi:hypothetical protein